MTVKVKIKLEVASRSFSRAQQLGLTNPALVAWEVVPFSFVFDWFVGVGDYLTALTALDGLKTIHHFNQLIIDSTWTHTQPGYSNPREGVDYRASEFTADLKLRQYNRLFAQPITLLSVRPPVNDIKDVFDKLTTSLSLLRAQGRRS